MDEKSEAAPRGGLLLSLDKIAITVVTLQAGAVAIADVTYCSTPRGNRKRTVGSGCHAPHMHPLVRQVRREDRSHDIARSKRVFRARFLRPRARKALGIHATHLTALLSHRPDKEWAHVLPE